MKKIYTLITGVLFASGITAQMNLNFEAPITHPSTTFPEMGTTAGWRPGLYAAETTDPGEGSQSCKLTTIVNPTIAGQMGSGTDTIGGFIVQHIRGEVMNPQNIDMQFKYKYNSVNNDTAVFYIGIYDSLQAGRGDDLLMYQGYVFLPHTPAWSSSAITSLFYMGPGTPNFIHIQATSSLATAFPFDNFVLPSPGSTFLIDDVVLQNFTFLGVEEPQLTQAKVYPNPTSEILSFTLENGEASRINIYGLDGKRMLSNKVNGVSGSIDVSGLNAGMYLYEITTVNGETVKSTFVKQ